MTRFEMKIVVAVMGIGMLVAQADVEVQAGRSGRSSGGRRSSGGHHSSGRHSSGRSGRSSFSNGNHRSFGHSNHRSNSNRSHNNHNNHNSHKGHTNHNSHGLFKSGRGHHYGHGWGFSSGKSHHYHGSFGFSYYRPHRGFGFVYVSRGHSYQNPYCSAPIGGYDYTSPIAPVGINADESILGPKAYAAAREAFLQEDYQTALQAITAAVKEMPNNTDAHQFRSLVLFAIGEYRDAAAIAHSAMTTASGWDWETLRSFYASADIYAAQLRALENARDAQPNAPELRFLLGYHYLILGHRDAANNQLARTIRLQPGDQVAQQMMKIAEAPVENVLPRTGGLGALAIAGGGSQPVQSPRQQPTIEQPQQRQPVERQEPGRQSLAGTWKATPVGGVEISFILNPDNSFTWIIARNGKKSQFSGQATINGNSLKLVRSETNETLDGTLTISGPNSFRIKLNDGKNNPELTFTR